jgi:hypothetical protein
MIAVARTWDEPEPLPQRAPLRPVARVERGLQLPLLPEEEGRSGPRRDRVPELTHYRDDGCQFWRACLACPFPRCLYDTPGGPKHAFNAYRDGVMRQMFAAGHTAAAIADEFGIARRSVYRILGGVRRREQGSRERGAGSRDYQPKSRAHMPRRARRPAPGARRPRD